MDWIDGLRLAKTQSGMTLTEIAEQSGVSYSSVSKIFAGLNTNPAINIVIDMCHAMGTTIDDIMLDSPNETAPTPQVEQELTEDEVNAMWQRCSLPVRREVIKLLELTGQIGPLLILDEVTSRAVANQIAEALAQLDTPADEQAQAN